MVWDTVRHMRSLAMAARWRLLALYGAFVATIPTWPALDGVFQARLKSPDFDAAELALLVAVVLLVPVAWVVVAPGPGRLVGALLVACAAGWSLATRLWSSWATPPTVDDVLRAYLATGCAIVVAALWLDRRRNPIVRRPWLGLALLGVACTAVVALPAVGNASIPPRDPLLPLPKGVRIVTEHARCSWRGDCERAFQLTATDGADPQEVKRRLIRHVEDRGWRIGVEHEDKACRRLGYLANPYQTCVSVMHLRGPNTVEVLFSVYNPREPWVLYA